MWPSQVGARFASWNSPRPSKGGGPFPPQPGQPTEDKELGQRPRLMRAWRVPRTGEPGGLSSMGLHRVGHD